METNFKSSAKQISQIVFCVIISCKIIDGIASVPSLNRKLKRRDCPQHVLLIGNGFQCIIGHGRKEGLAVFTHDLPCLGRASSSYQLSQHCAEKAWHTAIRKCRHIIYIVGENDCPWGINQSIRPLSSHARPANFLRLESNAVKPD